MSRRPPKSATLFVNPRSGRARRAFFDTVDALRESGIDVDSVRFDIEPAAIRDALHQTAREDRVIIACGGDGTIGSVVDGIIGENVLFGVIPAGTSNNFARSLGIPLNARRAACTIARGYEVQVDVGEAGGHYFAHAAIMGLNVEFARSAQRLRGIVGRFSYPLAAVQAYRQRRRHSVSFLESGRRIGPVDVFQVAVLNSAHFGGPLGLKAPRAAVQNHELRVLLLHDLRLRTVLLGLPRIFFQRHLGLPGAQSFGVKEGRIETPKPEPLTLDGEIKAQTPVDVRVIPGALRIVVPEPREKAEPTFLRRLVVLDRSLYDLVTNRMRDRRLDRVMVFASGIGTKSAVWMAISAGLLWAGGRHRRSALRTVAGVLLAQGTSNLVLKPLIKRRRPFADTQRLLIPPPGEHSWPSAHAASSVAAMIILGSAYPAWALPLILLGATISYSRVYVGVHFPLDVAAGAVVGLAAGGAALSIGRKRRPIFGRA
ncbi:MAG TPA: diacylglycerol kinase family protein [Chloroflexota bacterium]|nr:diacylglycerol kinase family protein [Chloroflexota bacterium]